MYQMLNWKLDRSQMLCCSSYVTLLYLYVPLNIILAHEMLTLIKEGIKYFVASEKSGYKITTKQYWSPK